MNRPKTHVCCAVLTLIGICVSTILAFNLWHIQHTILSDAIEQTRRDAVNTAAAIEANLIRFMPLINTLVDELESKRSMDRNLPKHLRALLETHPNLRGIGVAYAPFAFDPHHRLYAPYLMRRGDTIKAMQIEDLYDYTDPAIKWYQQAMQHGPGWDEPTWSQANGALISTYSRPFFRTDEAGKTVTAGVVYLSFPLEAIGRLVKGIESGETGWNLLLSRAGFIIAHPNMRDVTGRLNVFDYAKQIKDKVLLAAAKKMTAGQKGVFSFKNPDNGQALAIFYQPIPVTGWSLGVVRVKNEISFDVNVMRHRVIWLILSLIITLASLSMVLSAGQYKTHPIKTLWVRVLILSLLVTSASGTIAGLTVTPFRDNSTNTTKILGRNGRNAMLNELQDTRQRQHRETPLFVPTGLYLQTMEFNAPHHLFVTGYIWQKHPHGQRTSEGVHLPAAISAKITEAYRHQEGAIDIVGWHFEATLKQNMNYSKYPFAHETIELQLWPKEFNSDTVLIPDLEAYSFLNPTALPGLRHDLRLNGWSLKRSFFSFETHAFETNFGMKAYQGREDLLELRFNVQAERNLLDAMISHIIPIIIVATLLFVVLVTCTKDEDEAKRLGFNPSGVMRLSSGLLFVLLISHIQLRNAIQVTQIMFMEYYFFIMYLMIIFIVLHSLLFNVKSINIPIVEHEQSLIFKLLYWPTLFTLQLIVTVLIFY